MEESKQPYVVVRQILICTIPIIQAWIKIVHIYQVTKSDGLKIKVLNNLLKYLCANSYPVFLNLKKLKK